MVDAFQRHPDPPMPADAGSFPQDDPPTGRHSWPFEFPEFESGGTVQRPKRWRHLMTTRTVLHEHRDIALWGSPFNRSRHKMWGLWPAGRAR